MSQKGIWTAVKDNAALVTAILALFGVLITGAINTHIANKDQLAQQKLEAFNAQKQRELEEQKDQNAAFQTYLDQIGQMLISGDLRTSEERSEQLRTIARARTLAMLGQASPEKKRMALVFMSEAELIDNPIPIIGLSGADLSGTDLSGTDLSGTDLSGTDLSGTDLSGTDLSNASLSGARGITNEELQQETRYLNGTIMPDGQRYEEWLKSKSSKEEGENE